MNSAIVKLSTVPFDHRHVSWINRCMKYGANPPRRKQRGRQLVKKTVHPLFKSVAEGAAAVLKNRFGPNSSR